jgi:DNA-binding CsgD family transcriptional regulator
MVTPPAGLPADQAGPLPRLWLGLGGEEIISGLAPLVGGRSLLVSLSCPRPGAAPVLEAVLPLLVSRTIRCIGPAIDNPRSWLTLREQEVLEQLTLGRSVKEIAQDLGRSPHTVHDHVKSLHRKLAATTRGELIARALGHLVSPPVSQVEAKAQPVGASPGRGA